MEPQPMRWPSDFPGKHDHEPARKHPGGAAAADRDKIDVKKDKE